MDNNQKHDQLTLSLELLHLMRWIYEHDPEGVKKLISRAMTQGFGKTLHTADNVSSISDGIQHSIIDFFVLMEELMIEVLNEHQIKVVLQKNLFPAIAHIDSSAYDNATLRFSVERVTSQMQNNPSLDAQDLLMKELIKRWKPNKKALN